MGDRARRRAARTLRRRLLLLLLVPLLALAMIGAALDYRTALQLAHESHDRALAGAAIGLAARVETDRDGDLGAHLVATARALGRLTAEADMHHLVLDAQGRRLSGDERLAALIEPATSDNPALRDARLLGQPVRAVVYRYEGPDGRATIVVTESQARRTAAARRVLASTALTNLLMTLAVVLVSTLAVGLALRPLDRLSQRVQGLDRGDGDEGQAMQHFVPIALRGVPAETRPLIRAINRLMARVRRSTQARLAFINNTAHQLRTPLAGLQAQAELLADMPLPDAAAERARDIRQGVQRLSHLTAQMLSLARAAEGALRTEVHECEVDLPSLLEDVASACIDAALARDVDLGFEPGPARVPGSAWMLRELLVNLVQNAIEHTPRGTTVTVRCGTDTPPPAGTAHRFVEVDDDGPGIAPQARERVFERFVRLSEDAAGEARSDGRRGTGLGLAIVREIARRHGATVRILDGRSGRGTCVRVDFG